MLKNSFYRTFSYRTCAAAIAATLFLTGCESEHKKFAEPAKQDWEKAQLGIMYQVAEQEYKVGDYDKCRDALAKMLAVKAPFAPMHILMAKVDLEGGSLDDAASQLKTASTITPNDPEAYYLLGVVYQRWQKFETAADYYDQAAAKKPDQAIYVLASAEMKISLGQLDEARQYLLDKMMYFDQSAAIRVALARIAMLKADYAEAAKDYRDATLLVPEDKNIRWSYASALFDAGKYNDSARILEDLRSDPPVPAKALEVSAKAGQTSDTATDEQAQQAVKVSLLMMLGESYINLQRPIDARDCFQEAARLKPDSTAAYLSLGKACLLTNELNLTLAATQRVLRTEPNNVDAKILMGAVQQKQKKWSDALDTLSGAAKLDPKNSTILCMQGLSEIQLGKDNEAAGYLEKAVAVNPTDAWANELLLKVKPAAAQGTTPVSEPASAVSNAAGTELPNEAGVQGQ